MEKFFEKYKKAISSYLVFFLKKKEKKLAQAYPGGGIDLCRRLAFFSRQGKMVRGSLVILSYLMFRKKMDKEVVSVAAAVELFHSALLIHDDIMDRDNLRRGKETIFYQYQKIAQKKNFQDPYHFGVSAGICAGDAAFFLAMEILSNININPALRLRVIDFCSQELTKVGLAQMNEMYLGFSNGKLSAEKILSVYKFKTARYTFSLPLIIGAILAKQNSQTISKLDKLGECLGMMFQIKDDELGLFGSQKIIGKPVGTDVKEAKKTLYYYYLWKKASPVELARLKKIFGNSKLSKKDLSFVRSKVLQLGIKDIIDKKVNQYKSKSERIIQSLSVTQEYKSILLSIKEFIIARDK